MFKVPNVIYLQVTDDLGDEVEEATWCVDKINETDIEYRIANPRNLTTDAPNEAAQQHVQSDGAYPCNCFVDYGVDEYGNCKMCGGTP